MKTQKEIERECTIFGIVATVGLFLASGIVGFLATECIIALIQ